MDEEYDVIVLGTGLTVSSQPYECALNAGCANFHVVLNGHEETQARHPRAAAGGWKWKRGFLASK